MTVSDLRVRHATLHGHQVGYRMAGRGPVVLLIHGLLGSSHTWLGVMSILARNHTVVAPDLLGHGESAKPMGDYSLGAQASRERIKRGICSIGVEREREAIGRNPTQTQVDIGQGQLCGVGVAVAERTGSRARALGAHREAVAIVSAQ